MRHISERTHDAGSRPRQNAGPLHTLLRNKAGVLSSHSSVSPVTRKNNPRGVILIARRSNTEADTVCNWVRPIRRTLRTRIFRRKLRNLLLSAGHEKINNNSPDRFFDLLRNRRSYPPDSSKMPSNGTRRQSSTFRSHDTSGRIRVLGFSVSVLFDIFLLITNGIYSSTHVLLTEIRRRTMDFIGISPCQSATDHTDGFCSVDAGNEFFR